MAPGVWRPWLAAALLLLQVPGCVSQFLSSPISLVGTVGKSVSVICPYEKIYENNTKYWCKSPCLWKIVETTVRDVDVWNGRVSIRDVSATLSFRVTMRNLREDDAGTYRCGIDTSEVPGYIFDLTYPVVVSVTPGLHTVLLDPTQKTTTSQESPSSSQHPGPSPRSHPIEDQASKGEKRSLLSRIYFRLLVFLEVPLVLSMLSAVL